MMLVSTPVRSLGFVALTALAGLFASEVGTAQDAKVQKGRTVPVTSNANTDRPRQLAQSIDAENKLSRQEREQREEQALAFAKEHHPALEKLLKQLRGMDQKEYGRAIRELYRVSERLSSLKERNPRLYESQLKLWKVNSNATLLAARLQLNPGNDDLRNQLREALTEKRELQVKFMKEELERAQLRVERLERNLERFDEESQVAIERQMRQLAAPDRPSKKNPEKTTDGK